MKVGLFFGSFNPIHMGHMAIANYMVEFTDLDKLWFVVSPHNPLKKKQSLLPGYHRLEMVNRAIFDDSRFSASNIEFNLPQPSYTINTLVHLKEKYPDYEFVLIMGSDGLETFPRWKNFQIIENEFQRYIYPRPDAPVKDITSLINCRVVEAPYMEISSTFIRESIKNKKDIRYFMPEKAWHYLDEMNFYK
jgi:nicotinate-nucleotide adenylyltransferase